MPSEMETVLNSSARCADAFLYVDREFAEVVIARADFDPSVGYTDERLGEIRVAEPAGAQHGARARTVCAIDQDMAARL